jgi:O-antigen ligase
MSQTNMKTTHIIFGFLTFLIFLLTGQYMDHFYQHLRGLEDGPRLLFRTRHIFILLAGLLNLGIGAYFSFRPQLWRRILQLMGSALIMLASVLFIIAFFYEPWLQNLYTPLSHWGTYTILAGTMLHLFSDARPRDTDFKISHRGTEAQREEE